MSEHPGETFGHDLMDEAPSKPSTRQLQPTDDVNYTTNPYPQATASDAPQKASGWAIGAGNALWVVSVLLAVGAAALMGFRMLLLAIPVLILAGTLFFVGRGLLRKKAIQARERRE